LKNFCRAVNNAPCVFELTSYIILKYDEKRSVNTSVIPFEMISYMLQEENRISKIREES